MAASNASLAASVAALNRWGRMTPAERSEAGRRAHRRRFENVVLEQRPDLQEGSAAFEDAVQNAIRLHAAKMRLARARASA